MDWCLPDPDAHSVTRLRREIAEHLARHAAPGEDVAGAVLAVSEAVTNAVLHGGGPVWVSLDWRGPRPRLEVHDLGPGFVLDTRLPIDPTTPGGRGLFILDAIVDDLAVSAKRSGGSRLEMVLPVRRPSEPSYPTRQPRPDALPDPEEARGDGTFGRESFLRALAVQLAHSVERTHGPAAAEAAVSEVGTDVGARMEEAFRRARGIDGELGHGDMAELFVLLKDAIGGEFRVVSVGEDEIVLANRACPFGDVVRRAPGLCRMTSSVFGGIAARNAGRSEVVLEERIAVGDPGCLVRVRLRGSGPAEPHAHGYDRAMPDAGSGAPPLTR